MSEMSTICKFDVELFAFEIIEDFELQPFCAKKSRLNLVHFLCKRDVSQIFIFQNGKKCMLDIDLDFKRFTLNTLHL